MRESARSLRWYFGIIGVFYVISTAFLYGILGSIGGSMGLIVNSPLLTAQTIVGALVALGYLYFAIMLPKYLDPVNMKYVNWFLFASFGVTVLWSLISLATGGQISIFNIGIAALITWYLYRNVNRISSPPVKA